MTSETLLQIANLIISGGILVKLLSLASDWGRLNERVDNHEKQLAKLWDRHE